MSVGEFKKYFAQRTFEMIVEFIIILRAAGEKNKWN